jgi:hypothetical protein
MPLFGSPSIEKLTTKRDVEGLVKALRESETPARLLRLRENNNRDRHSEAAAEMLGMASFKEPADALLEYLFKHPDDGRRAARFRPLFEDYAELIIALAGYTARGLLASGHTYKYVYNLEDAEAALARLCAIQTPVATNVLHKVHLKGDVQVDDQLSDAGFLGKTLSFESLRDGARAELTRRGNPELDPTAYFADAAWKLPS